MGNVSSSIDYLKFSLQNVQSNIQFVDKKVGAAVSLMTLGLGLVLPGRFIARIVFAIVQDPSCWISTLCIFMSLAACVLFFYRFIREAVAIMTPRPPQTNRSSQLLLFPYVATTNDAYTKCMEDLKKKIAGGVSYETVSSEFVDQLSNLGWIQAQKMDHCKKLFEAGRSLVLACAILTLLSVLKALNDVTALGFLD